MILSDETRYAIYTHFLRCDLEAPVLISDKMPAYSPRCGLPAPVLLLLSVIAPFRSGTFDRDSCANNLKGDTTQVRFCEDARSSPLMMVLIGAPVGLSDLCATIAVFGISAMMNLFAIVIGWSAVVPGPRGLQPEVLSPGRTPAQGKVGTSRTNAGGGHPSTTRASCSCRIEGKIA